MPAREAASGAAAESVRLRIGDVARLCGVSAGMLRNYEAKGLIMPMRDAGGDRLYARADVARIEVIRTLSLAGVSLTTVAVMLFGGGALPAQKPTGSSPLPEQLDLLELRQAAIATAIETLQRFL